jgi:hypothetical protein
MSGALCVLAGIGCAGGASSLPAAGPSYGAAGTIGDGTEAGPGAADGGAGGARAADGASPGGDVPATPSTTAPSSAEAPGKYVTNESAGASISGACAGVTLPTILDEIRAAVPALADITTIYNPVNQVGDGSFIYPYVRADGGFDVVFKRGAGDCPSGCIDNAYWYFATDAGCHVVEVGHYHATWGAGNCLTVDGAAMWSHPAAADPLTVCGQDNAAQDLRGTYLLHARGQRTPCVATPAKAGTIDATVTLVIEQGAKDLSAGFVTFTGTGHPLVDGVRLPARFQRSRFDAALQTSNLPSTCAREQSVTSRYDFENYQPGALEVNESGNDACAMCKGQMSLALTATSLTQAP